MSGNNSASAYDLSDRDIQDLTQLLEIIESQKWEVFGSIIISNPAVFQSLSRAINRTTQLNGMTILHACVRYNPPPHIVKMILDLVPESLTSTDFSLRTPLHIAVGKQARLSTIEALVNFYPDACFMQDLQGKTPLHLACDGACILFETDLHDDLTIRTPRFDMIRTLIDTCPGSVQLEDYDGMSALEYAILSDAPLKVVELPQITTRTECEQLHWQVKRSTEGSYTQEQRKRQRG